MYRKPNPRGPAIQSKRKEEGEEEEMILGDRDENERKTKVSMTNAKLSGSFNKLKFK